MKTRPDRRGGFTLFEVMISIAIFSAVLFVVASFRGNLTILQNIAKQKLQSRQDLEQTFQILVTEIRSAGPSSLGAYPVVAGSSSTFTFYSDIDKDGLFERVRYFLGTSTLQKGVVKPSGNPPVYATSSEIVSTVVVNVIPSTSTPLFSYFGPGYTGSEAPLALPLDITRVRTLKITLWADINPKTAPIPILFTDTVNIRNLRAN